MTSRPAFGRRAGPQPQLRPQSHRRVQVPRTQSAVVAPQPVVPPPPAPEETKTLDLELREWRRARKSAFKIPWRPLSLMASLCFGIASFALPSAINDVVQWPLYALTAISLYVGISTRRAKAKA